MKVNRYFWLVYAAMGLIALAWLLTSLFILKVPQAGVITFCLIAVFFLAKFFEQSAQREFLSSLQKKLKRMESKAWYYETIVTNSRDIIFTTDRDHRIIKFNKGSEAIFGLMAWEVLGKDVGQLFNDAHLITPLLKEIESTGLANGLEISVRNRDTQEEMWLSVGVSRLINPDENGKMLTELQTFFAGAIFTCKDVTQRRMLEQELKEKNEQLIRLSLTDSLTGLYNIRHLNSELQRLSIVGQRYPDRALTLVLMDVDKFKEYNDQLGHLAGDHLLCLLGDILQAQIRKNLDSAYRYGGDEFVLLLPDTDENGARGLCVRILSEFLNARLGCTSLSMGIAQYHKSWGPLSASIIISKADEAMYMVKVRGGNEIHVYGQELPDSLRQRDPDPNHKIPQ